MILLSWPSFPNCIDCIKDSISHFWYFTNLGERNKLSISNKIFWAYPLFTFSVVTRSNSWSWSNCTVTLSVSGAKSITRAGSWRNWRESLLLYCPGCLSNTSPYGGPGASCLFWFTSSIFLCHLSFLCLFIFLSLSGFHHHPIYSICLSLWSNTFIQFVAKIIWRLTFLTLSLPLSLLVSFFLCNSLCISIIEFWYKVAAGC